MCAGLFSSRFLSVIVFSLSLASLLIQERGPEAKFSPHEVTEGRGREGGRGNREMHSCKATTLRKLHIRNETTLIFNEHTRSYFSGGIQRRGAEWVIFYMELWQTWLEYDTRFGRKDASPSRAIDAAAAMATSPWIKAMWIIMGWLTHNARPALLHKLSLN